MTTVLEEATESVMEADGGLICGGCEEDERWERYPVLDARDDTLYGECPVHGKIALDVSDIAQEIRDERHWNADDDGDHAYDLHRDMERELR